MQYGQLIVNEFNDFSAHTLNLFKSSLNWSKSDAARGLMTLKVETLMTEGTLVLLYHLFTFFSPVDPIIYTIEYRP